jgi:hypothetical protein
LPVAPKKKVSDLKVPIDKKVEQILKSDPEHAYHTTRIMVDHFEVKESDIEGSFKDWKNRKAIGLWKKVKDALDDLVENKKAEKVREGKADWYWWKSDRR